MDDSQNHWKQQSFRSMNGERRSAVTGSLANPNFCATSRHNLNRWNVNQRVMNSCGEPIQLFRRGPIDWSEWWGFKCGGTAKLESQELRIKASTSGENINDNR
jgi:hypothetical protein